MARLLRFLGICAAAQTSSTSRRNISFRAEYRNVSKKFNVSDGAKIRSEAAVACYNVAVSSDYTEVNAPASRQRRLSRRGDIIERIIRNVIVINTERGSYSRC